MNIYLCRFCKINIHGTSSVQLPYPNIIAMWIYSDKFTNIYEELLRGNLPLLDFAYAPIFNRTKLEDSFTISQSLPLERTFCIFEILKTGR